MKQFRKHLWLFLVAAVSFSGLAFVDYTFSGETSGKQSVGLAVGDRAPDLAFPDPNGKIRKLSDLRGKVVLIDFWASWCRPCRLENPNVVRVYNTYKDKKMGNASGFEVFSVSLDQQHGAWTKAIQADGLVWPNHVSDLKFWHSEAARLYNVNSIPATYLIDENGIIIAKNLRGAALENTLAKLAR